MTVCIYHSKKDYTLQCSRNWIWWHIHASELSHHI